MGSFYLPTIIMIFLYWRIYRVLRLRAQAALRSKKAKMFRTANATSNVIENTPSVYADKQTQPTVNTRITTATNNGKLSSYNTTKLANELTLPVSDDVSITNANTDSQSSERVPDEDGSAPKSPASTEDVDEEEEVGELIVNPVAVRHVEIQLDGNGNGTCITETPAAVETKFSTCKSGNNIPPHTCILPNSGTNNSNKKSNAHRRKQKRGVAKFNFHMRTSRKRKEKSSTRKERKATKTLAIVLGKYSKVSFKHLFFSGRCRTQLRT